MGTITNNALFAFMKLATTGLLGVAFGFVVGYMIGSDNGFVKGCNWAYYNKDKK